MQPRDESQDWQQPPQAPAGVSQQVPSMVDAPLIEGPQSVPEPTEPITDTLAEAPDEASTDDYEQTESDDQGSEVANDDDLQGDESVLRWQAAEYIQQEQPRSWFIVFGVVVVVMMAIAFFLMKSITFAILIPVMAVALVVYVKRPAAIHDYTLSRKGLHVDDKLFGYDQFRAFGVLSGQNGHAVVLTPRKRFQLGHTVYFPEEVGEPLVDMLAARLPMQEAKLDVIDSILVRLRL